MIIMAAAIDNSTRSPFIVRAGFALPQVTAPIAEWALKNNIKSVVSLVTDYGPGLDAEKTFVKRFTEGGGTVLESLRTPLQGPDYAPFLQRTKDAKPDALFVFVPSGQGTAVMKQFAERGLAAAGIKLICTGDLVDDDILDAIGSPALGIVIVPLAALHRRRTRPMSTLSAKAKSQMSEFHVGRRLRRHAPDLRGGENSGRHRWENVAAMKGMAWTSPRGRCRSTRRPAM
jgi:branched-chain amino acid transport system substrate-binding protein